MEMGERIMRDWIPKAVVALVVVLLTLPGVSHALTDEQKALVGLQGVRVSAEFVEPEAERLGLTKAQIQTDVELRLRKAGVRIITEEEWLKKPGGFLYVAVDTQFREDPPIVVYSIRVEFKELVRPTRGGDTLLASTWLRGGMGSVGKSKIAMIRGALGDQVDQFINDYLAANPKK